MNDITTPEVVEIKARDHREMNMALARMAGATYRQIGEEFGLSRQRVYQILTRMNVDVVGPTFGKAKYGHTPGENTQSDEQQGRTRYYPPGEPIFITPPKRPARRFRSVISKHQRRQDVETCRDLFSKLGRLPYVAEVAEARYPGDKRMGPVVQSHWVTHKARPGKHSYTKYRNRMYIAAFGWGTKAPDGRSYLAALAQQTKEQAKWLTA